MLKGRNILKMCRWTLTINLLWICFFQCHIVCDDNFYDQQGHVTHRTFRHSKPSGKALEDICDCALGIQYCLRYRNCLENAESHPLQL